LWPKTQVCRWNFGDIYRTFGDISISGLGGHIAGTALLKNQGDHYILGTGTPEKILCDRSSSYMKSRDPKCINGVG